MNEAQTDAVLFALASAPRRRLLDLIKAMPGCGVNDVAKYFEISRIGVMKHLRVLAEAGLVVSEKRGRSREMFFNSAPIQLIHDRWSDQYSDLWGGVAADIKYKAEAAAKSATTKQRGTGKSAGPSRRKKPTRSKAHG